MAGGPTTVELARAVTEAGGFAFLAAGNKRADAIACEIDELRLTTDNFGVNLFVPPTECMPSEAYQEYAARMRPEAATYGLEIAAEPTSGDDEWSQKIELLLHSPVSVVSLTFGLCKREVIASFQRAGSRVVATVTSASEALNAASLGVDALTVQGHRAGGHSAVHDVRSWPSSLDTGELLEEVRGVVDLPLVAAGGVDGSAAVRDLLLSGADAVAVGTMLLRSDEAGTTAVQRAAMRSDVFAETVLSRAFTGRPARGLRNGFIDRHHDEAPWGYPEVHYLTRPLRQAAAEHGDADRLHMWAGTGYRSAPDGPAAEIMAQLASEIVR